MSATRRGARSAGAGPITLLTDFGTRDGYVAALHGVIAALAPGVTIHDAAHDIPRGDITAAAACLAAYWQLFPAGAIHVVVVDPGVGGSRRALAAEADGRFLVGPDNGVLTPALDLAAAVHEITAPAYMRSAVSATFHGRDIFAPAAAHIALGVRLGALGAAVTEPVRSDASAPNRTDGAIHGVVVHVDQFGNLITNIPASWLPADGRVRVGRHALGSIRRTYGDVATGELIALVGSSGTLEIAVRDGSAAAFLGAARGATVVVKD